MQRRSSRLTGRSPAAGHRPARRGTGRHPVQQAARNPLAPAPAGNQPVLPPVPPVVIPPVPAFALTPALASRGIIDYQSRSGERLYSSATKQTEEDKYDGESSGLHQFLESLEKRAKNFGWDKGILMIPSVTGAPQSSLLRDYGTIDIARVRAYESSYIDTQSRDAQDTNLLHECIMNSISKEGRAKITIWKLDYMVRGYPSGNLLLKVLIRECHLDTNATSGGIRAKLSSLDAYLPTVGYDIMKFNIYIKNLVIQLKARGESSNDLLTNLFKGYLIATDKTFVAYIEKKLELYEEGTNINPDQLMLWARQKFDLLKEKGTWNAPTDEEEKIIALETQVRKMEKRLKDKTNTATRTPVKDKERDTSRRKEKPKWFETEPKEPKKKVMWNGKEWNWCGSATGGKCESFVRHPPSKCKGIKKRKSEGEGESAKNPRIRVEAAEVESDNARHSNNNTDDDDGYESH